MPYVVEVELHATGRVKAWSRTERALVVREADGRRPCQTIRADRREKGGGDVTKNQ